MKSLCSRPTETRTIIDFISTGFDLNINDSDLLSCSKYMSCCCRCHQNHNHEMRCTKSTVVCCCPELRFPWSSWTLCSTFDVLPCLFLISRMSSVCWELTVIGCLTHQDCGAWKTSLFNFSHYLRQKSTDVQSYWYSYLCNCNWSTFIAPPRRPRAHHRVNPYLGGCRIKTAADQNGRGLKRPQTNKAARQNGRMNRSFHLAVVGLSVSLLCVVDRLITYKRIFVF